MCAIAGIINLEKRYQVCSKSKLKKEEMQKLLKNILEKLHSGGRDASGIFMGVKPVSTYNTKGKILSFKAPVASNKLLDIDGAKKIYDKIDDHSTLYIIAHARAATTGDENNNSNNHPFISGNIIGIHNGCISLHKSLAREENVELKTECDSEVIFALLNKHAKDGILTQEAIKDTCKKLNGWFACAAACAKEYNKIILFRDGVARLSLLVNSGPFVTSILFCTDRKTLEYAIEKSDLSNRQYVGFDGLSCNTGMIIDTFSDKWEDIKEGVFKLDDDEDHSADDGTPTALVPYKGHSIGNVHCM